MNTFKRSSDELSCRQIAKELQSYLDGEDTKATRERIRAHLDACKRCGLEAETFERIKASLNKRAPTLDNETIERLRAFGQNLAQD